MSTPEYQQYWQQQMTEWQASDLSGAAFCRQHALSYDRFVYWRRKLMVGPSLPPVQAAGFARVVPSQAVVDGPGLCVSLPSGVAIAGLNAGNVALLGAILRQL